jgi:hypothetical protein
MVDKAQTYQFIDAMRSDRDTKRLIRSHAMRGKNVGKTHVRRSRLAMTGNLSPQLSTDSQVSSGNSGVDASRSTPTAENVLSMPRRNLGYLVFPVEVTGYDMRLIDECTE